jgi:hypothetical protein
MTFVSPIVIVSLAIVLVALSLWAMTTPSLKWLPFSLLIAASGLGLRTNQSGAWLRPPAPFDYLVLERDRIVASILVILIVGYGTQVLRITKSYVPATAWGFLAIHIVLIVFYIFSGNINDGVMRLSVYLLVFLLGGVLIPSLLDSMASVRNLAIAIAFGGGLFAAGNLTSMALDYGAGFVAGRWFGLTSNPNHVGIFVALTLPTSVGVAISPGASKSFRILSWVMAGMLLFMLLLSLSRGGAAAAFVGLLIVVGRNLGRSIVILAPLAVLLVVVLSFSGYANEDFDRFVSAENTRAHVPAIMIAEWLENPILGDGSQWGARENAYLGMLVRSGIIGGIVMVAVGVLIIRQIVAVAMRRGMLGADRVYVDIAIAGIVTVMASSMFEATFFSNFNQTIFLIYAYLAMLDISHRACAYGTATTHVANIQVFNTDDMWWRHR